MFRWRSQITFLSAFALVGLAMAVLVNSNVSAALSESEFTVREFSVDAFVPAEEPLVVVVKQDLTEFLELAAKYNGYQVKFSGAVNGTLENTSLPMNMLQLMSKLEKAFDLKWFAQSSRIFISKGSVQLERTLSLDEVEIDILRAAIKQHGIASDEYEMRPLNNHSAVSVTGAASHLDGIELIITQLRENKGDHE